MSGEDLLLQDKSLDAYLKPIKIGIRYEVRLYYRTKSVTILSEEDWWIKDCYELGEDIIMRGGLFDWVRFGRRLGFFKDFKDCYETIEDMIDCFNKREDFDKSIHFRDELKKLKENEK